MKVNFSNLSRFGQWIMVAGVVAEYEDRTDQRVPDLGERLDVVLIINDVEVDFLKVLEWLESESERWEKKQDDRHRAEMAEVRANHITIYELATLYGRMQELKASGEQEE